MFLLLPPLPLLSQHRQREEQPLTSLTLPGFYLTLRPVLQRNDFTTVLPLQGTGPLDSKGRQFMTYVLFASNDLYNWKLQNFPCLERPSALTGFLDSGQVERMTQILKEALTKLTFETGGRCLGISPTLCLISCEEHPLYPL